MDERNFECLVAFDLGKIFCTLAWMVISYSHLFAVWKKFVSQKHPSAIKSVYKWLTYRVSISYAVIDPGKHHSQKDVKDQALYENMINDHVEGCIGCCLNGHPDLNLVVVTNKIHM